MLFWVIGGLALLLLAVNVPRGSYAAVARSLGSLLKRVPRPGPPGDWFKSLLSHALACCLTLAIYQQWFLPGPTPPEPEPTPIPVPVVDDAPFPASELTVVIVEEATGDRSSLPESQLQIFTGGAIWMDAEGVEYRVLDDEATNHDGSPWTEALAAPRESLPWLLVANGNKGFSGPLPASLQEFKAVVGGLR